MEDDYKLMRCPECGYPVYEWVHQPCSDHPELTEDIRECCVCNWSEVI